MSTGIRRTLYLSEKKDGDIIEFIEPMIVRYDFSTVIRELVRDGIKYRQGEARMVLQSNTPAPQLNIKLKKREVDNDAFKDRMDNF
jgi:hypothetical protein